ncbi:MAG: ATP-binding protein [Myxococcota bacterium]
MTSLDPRSATPGERPWRWLLLAAVGAVALLASQAVAWRSLRRAVDAAHRSEAEVMLARFREAMENEGSPSDLIEGFFADQEPEGLVFARVRGADGALEIGEAPGGEPLRSTEGEAQVAVTGELVRARWTPPPLPPPPGARRSKGPGPVRGALPRPSGRPPPPFPPGERGHASPGRAGGLGGPPAPRLPRSLEVAFRPQLGPVLERDARTGLLASLAGAAFLVLLAFALTRAQREREEAAARAAKDRQLAALGEMTAVLAHEIRNPLASLKGHAQLLQERLEGPSRDKAGRVVADAVRLETLTRQLLAFVRTGTVSAAPVDLGALVTSVADALDATVALEGSAKAHADPALLRQALTNVVSNAVAAGGPVSVVLRRDARLVRIEVLDRGPGLPEDVTRLFEPFHTTRAQGTGLGLAITKRVMEAHAGWIEASNREGGGARFCLVLPEGR